MFSKQVAKKKKKVLSNSPTKWSFTVSGNQEHYLERSHLFHKDPTSNGESVVSQRNLPGLSE